MSVEVTQADREAQKYYWSATVAGTTDVGGEILALAFARHRIEAERGALERAAQECEKRFRLSFGKRVADFIRSLIGESE